MEKLIYYFSLIYNSHLLSGGVFVTFLYFSVVSVILDLSVSSAFYVSVGLCLLLTIGLAFVQSVRCNIFICDSFQIFLLRKLSRWNIYRCVTLSIIPEICTQQARSVLVSYALVLMITGPGSNILYNTRQLTETITCTRVSIKFRLHYIFYLLKIFNTISVGFNFHFP